MRSRNQWLHVLRGLALPFCVFIFCAGRFLWIIQTYSVNVFIGDQWDYNEPLLFHRQSAWTIFRWQCSPWRQGLGGLLSAWTGQLTHWDSRYESFIAGILIITACLLALYLKVRVSGKVTAWDALIPLFVLTPVQYETIVGVTHFSHGPLPLLFVLAFCVAWTIRAPKLKYAVLLPLTFASTYTGFGMFIGLLCPLALTLDMWTRRPEMSNSEKRSSAIALTLASLSLASFLIGYKTVDGVCPLHGFQNPLHYFLFAAFMFANFVGLKVPLALVPSILGGSALLLFVMGMFIFAIRKRQIIPLILISYSLLFAVGAAHGRMCLGLAAAVGSRYMIYLVPAFLGIYLLVSGYSCLIQDRAVSTAMLSILTILAVLSSLTINSVDRKDMTEFWQHRLEWRQCYLAEHNLSLCNQRTGATMYTYPDRIQEKINFLEAHQLNLFSQ